MDARRLVIELGPRTLLALADSKGARVRCLAGTVWITEENDRNDVVLQAGESYVLARNGRALVQAIRAARIGVEAGLSAADLSGIGLRRPAPRLQAVPA